MLYGAAIAAAATSFHIAFAYSTVGNELVSTTDFTQLTALSASPPFTSSTLSTPLPVISTPSLLTPSLTSHPSILTSSPTPPPSLFTSSTSLAHPPPLPTPPYHGTPAMEIDPMVYLIAGPLALGVMLGLILSLICCIAAYLKLRRRKTARSRSQSFKQRNSTNRIDQSKSLEAYGGNGCGPCPMEKAGGLSRRYELHTLDDNSRASISSPVTTHNSSKYFPPDPRLHPHTGSSSTHIISGQPRMSESHSASQSSSHSPLSPQRMQSSSLPMQADPRLCEIPEHSVAQEVLSMADGRQAMSSMTSVRAASLPHTSSGVLDPTSLYDVPVSSLSKEAGGLLGVYDVPKSALIASGHYKVPPLSQSECDGLLSHQDILPPATGIYDIPPPATGIYDIPPPATGIYDIPPPATGIYDIPPPTSGIYDIPPPTSGIYDIPPPTTGIYDIPPDVHRYFQQGVDVYDVPATTGSRPRQNSEPASNRELGEVRRSVAGSSGSDSVFTPVVPDHSHYDVPKHLLIAYMEEQPQARGTRLSRRNSNPGYLKNGMIYDIPREALLAQNNASLTGPATAPKPSKRTSISRSRSQSTSSPREMASPEHTPHPNAAFYDLAPLTAEFHAQWQKDGKVQATQEVDASHPSKSQQHRKRTPTHGSSRSPARVHSSSRSPSRTHHNIARAPSSEKSPARPSSSERSPARTRAQCSSDKPPAGPSKKRKVPPPTKRRPGKDSTRK